MFEMLASNKTPNAEFLRLQRAFLLKSISNSWKTPEQIQKALKEYNLDLYANAIANHISGLIASGLNISELQGKFKLVDKITHLEIQTAELFTKESNFEGLKLGDANSPDVIIFYDHNGTIIDNKSYKDGFKQ